MKILKNNNIVVHYSRILVFIPCRMRRRFDGRINGESIRRNQN